MTDDAPWRLVAELDDAGPLTIVVSAMAALELAVTLQIALQHADVIPADVQRSCAWFIAHVRAHVAACPAALALLDAPPPPQTRH